jgi:hypothetical protein
MQADGKQDHLDGQDCGHHKHDVLRSESISDASHAANPSPERKEKQERHHADQQKNLLAAVVHRLFALSEKNIPIHTRLPGSRSTPIGLSCYPGLHLQAPPCECAFRVLTSVQEPDTTTIAQKQKDSHF